MREEAPDLAGAALLSRTSGHALTVRTAAELMGVTGTALQSQIMTYRSEVRRQ